MILTWGVTMKETMNLYDSVSPLDYRYYGRKKSVFDKAQPYPF